MTPEVENAGRGGEKERGHSLFFGGAEEVRREINVGGGGTEERRSRQSNAAGRAASSRDSRGGEAKGSLARSKVPRRGDVGFLIA